MVLAMDLALPRFTMGEQPSAGVLAPANASLLPISPRIAFALSAAAVSWVLDGVDEGRSPADSWPQLGDVCDGDPFGEEAAGLAALVYADEDRQSRLLSD